jgi:YgiT-type zinc finger domain-containing protein
MNRMSKTLLMPDRCEYCDGAQFVEKTVEKMHRHKGRYYLFRKVPVIVCRSCGERYWSGPVLRQITHQIEESRETQENLTVPVLQLGA